MPVLELVRGTGTSFVCEFSTSGGYERSPDTFHLTFDPEAEPASHAVVKSAAFVHNADPTTMSPLGDVIDPDALDAIVATYTSESCQSLEVEFNYEKLEVTVASDGDIWLTWS